MALKDINTSEEYPYIFMTSQNIQQRIPNHVDDPAEYFLSITVQFYKVVDGVVIMDPDTQLVIDDDNFTSTAMLAAYGGDMTHANTLGAQQLSVKAMVESATGRTFEVV